LGAATLRSMRYSLGVLVASAAVSAYHGAIFRQDRNTAVVGHAVGPRSVVLIGTDDPALARMVHQATGSRVELWERTDVNPIAWDETSVLTALSGHPGQDLVLTADEQGFQLMVVEPRR